MLDSLTILLDSQYLRVQHLPVQTFLPLETIVAKPVNDKFRSYHRGARLAIDVIQYDATVERAMQHVCGNALVCDSTDIAKTVVYEKGQEVKGEFYAVRFPLICPLIMKYGYL